MRIAITGATSFIGRHLIMKCIEEKWDVVSVIREGSYRRAEFDNFSNISVIECNMDDYDSLAERVGTVDCLVYLTWNGTRGNDRNDIELQKKNFEIAKSTIESFVNKGCKIVLTAGSQAEYGVMTGTEKIKEYSIANPVTEYGKYKLKLYQELAINLSDKDIRLIEPRFFSLYGTDDFEGTMVISILRKMLKNEPCDLTECVQMWDFLHIDDAVDGLIRLINDENAEGVFNFGSGESYQLKHFVEIMYRLTNSNSKLNFGAVPYPETGMVNVNPCVDKLKSLGWEPKIKFEEGIKDIINSLI